MRAVQPLLPVAGSVFQSVILPLAKDSLPERTSWAMEGSPSPRVRSRWASSITLRAWAARGSPSPFLASGSRWLMTPSARSNSATALGSGAGKAGKGAVTRS